MPRHRPPVAHACLLLILCILCVTGRGQEVGGGTPGEVSVNNSEQLYAALANQSVSTIVVTSDVALREPEWGSAPYAPGEPLLLERNVTLRFDPRWGVLDLRFLQQRIRLAPGVTLALEDVLLRHSRYGSGIQLLDILAASPGGTLAMSGISTRIACVPNDAALPRLKAAPRPPGFPGPQVAHDLEEPLCIRDQCYSVGVIHDDIVLQPALTEEPGGGYTVALRNFTRLCAGIVSADCVRDTGPDACVRQYIDANTDLATPGSPGGRQMPSSSKVALAVGVVIGGVVLLVIAGVLMLWRRKRRRRRQQLEDLKYSLPIVACDPGQLTLMSPEEMAKGQADLAPTSSSWEITAARTSSDCMQSTGSSNVSSGRAVKETLNAVQLGTLLGAGSFGRVYKGRWMGRVVAVKVLHHSIKSAELVLNEVNLMLSFKHPNVVRAYHVINWAHRRRPMEPPDPLPSTSESTTLGATATMPSTAAWGGSTAGSNRGRSDIEEAQTWIVQEYCDGGNLGDVFLSNNASSGLQEELQQGPPSSGPAAQPPPPPQQQQEEQQAAPPPSQQQQQAPPPVVGSDQPSSSRQQAPLGSAPQPGVEQRRGQEIELQPASPVSPVSPDPVRPHDLLQQLQEQHVQQAIEQQQQLSQQQAAAAALRRLKPQQRRPLMMLKLLCRLKEVAQAMQYLHARNVVHGDLKVANVLLASCTTAPFGMMAKVTDFGLSRALQVGQTHRSTRTLGTVSHMAPELLRLGRMSSAADVYAFGIMMWEMVTGRIAFAEMHYGEVVERVGIRAERPPIAAELPTDYADLMRSCWAELPTVRPTFSQVVDLLTTMIESRHSSSSSSSSSAAALDVSEFGPEDL